MNYTQNGHSFKNKQLHWNTQGVVKFELTWIVSKTGFIRIFVVNSFSDVWTSGINTIKHIVDFHFISCAVLWIFISMHSILSRHFLFSTISDQFVENPNYIMSKRGKFMLIHNGFKFTSDKKGKFDMKTRWRCSYIENKRYTCKASAFTYVNSNGIKVAEFKGTHHHAQPIWIMVEKLDFSNYFGWHLIMSNFVKCSNWKNCFFEKSTFRRH